MSVYCGSLTLYTFVDNLSYVSNRPDQLIQGFLTSQTFHRLWGLSFDDDKTFAWSTTTEGRKSLQALGFTTKKDASELGGIMNYTRKQHVRLLQAREAKLEDKWHRLKTSSAPTFRKLWALPCTFWSTCLHASYNCTLSTSYLHELRRKAMKGLRWQAAGTNSQIKLVLSGCPMADPGFYDLKTGVITFIRLLRKSTTLLELWNYEHQQANGRTHPGPLTTLQCRLDQLHWHVLSPPLVIDHEGYTHDFASPDVHFLCDQLYDGWLQHVARNVKHKTMHDLRGVERHLAILDHGKLRQVDFHRVLALQSGAFLSAAQHAKYDVNKSADCSVCGVTDDRKHWLECPRFLEFRANLPWNWPDRLQRLPDSIIYHLLPPLQPEWHALRDFHATLPDHSRSFCSLETQGQVQHLFTDGSCHDPSSHYTARASWAVINANTGSTIAASQLHGPRQSIDRAELVAIISAVAWGQCVKQPICIWSDSRSTVLLAEQIEELRSTQEIRVNLDLWTLFLDLVQREGMPPRAYRWIPSHLPAEDASDSFEDWASYWNGRADWIANLQNAQRPTKYWQQRDQIREEIKTMSENLHLLRSFYLQIANMTEKPAQIGGGVEPAEIMEGMDLDSPFDELPMHWEPPDHAVFGGTPFPAEAIQAMLCHLQQWDREGTKVYDITDIEVSCALILTDFLFPFREAQTRQWLYRKYHDCFERPTLTKLIRFVAVALGSISEVCFDGGFRLSVSGVPSIGIQMQCKAMRLRMPQSLFDETSQRLREFCSRRPIRKAADLSRPI